MSKPAPLAFERTETKTVHGETLSDPFAWLRVQNWTEVMRNPDVLDGEVRAHLEAENAHTEAFFASRSDLRETLLDEMRGRIKEDDSSVPQNDGPFAYSTRYEVGGEHPRYCRRPRDGGLEDEVVLLDGDALAQGHAYWNLAAVDHAPDHAHIAYAVDLKGSEIYTVKFRTADGSDLEDEIEGTSGNFTWAPDGRHVFYTVLDDNHRPSKVMRHELGTSADRDAVVFEEGDPGFFVGVSVTESERFIVIDSHDHVTSEARLIDARTPTREPTVVRPREAGVEYDVGHHGDHLIIRTNKDGAEDYKVVRCPLTGDWAHDWEDLIPHESGRLIANVLLYARYMVRLERVDALPRIVVRTMSTGAEEALTFDEAVYTLGAHGSLEFDTDVLRFSYGSMATPSRVYDQDMRTGTRTLRKEQEVPSGHDPSAYVVERIMARAADGEAVPVSILRRAGVEGPAPCLLYGYGAYGNSMPAGFSTARLSLVDRGFVFAIAHVRGGMERGYRWYRLGKGRHKGNTFTDFVAAADALIEGGYTSKGRIAARGGSAGGMLMGWLVNNAPDTFGAVVAEVPFVDVLNTMLDPTLPLTPPEWPEWGNPIEDPAAFARIRGYSPYDNVDAIAHPPILVTAGLTDPRVTYWEPAKWVAKLRRVGTGSAPLLLKTNMSAGHAGAAGRFERLEEEALVQAFLLMILEPSSE